MTAAAGALLRVSLREPPTGQGRTATASASKSMPGRASPATNPAVDGGSCAAQRPSPGGVPQLGPPGPPIRTELKKSR